MLDRQMEWNYACFKRLLDSRVKQIYQSIKNEKQDPVFEQVIIGLEIYWAVGVRLFKWTNRLALERNGISDGTGKKSNNTRSLAFLDILVQWMLGKKIDLNDGFFI